MNDPERPHPGTHRTTASTLLELSGSLLLGIGTGGFFGAFDRVVLLVGIGMALVMGALGFALARRYGESIPELLRASIHRGAGIMLLAAVVYVIKRRETDWVWVRAAVVIPAIIVVYFVSGRRPRSEP